MIPAAPQLALPPPGTPEQVEMTDKVALAVLSIPEDRRSEAVDRIVWLYFDSVQRAFPEYGEDLHAQSTVNFIRALRRRIQSLHFTTSGHVGQA